MIPSPGRLLSQPMVAIAAGIGGLAAIGLAAVRQAPALTLTQAVLALALMAAVPLAYQFPIYIRHNTKICLISTPLFLLAALLPPAVAGAGVFLSLIVGEASVMSRRGTTPGDVITMAGRWTVIAVAASACAHVSLPLQGPLGANLPIGVAAVILWGGDLLTLPAALAPVCGERPLTIMRTALREGGVAEAAQYVLGIVGVLLAHQQVWALLLLLVPIGLVHFAFRKVMDTDTVALLENMADTVDLRGGYTAGHSQRVRDLVAGILDELGMHGQEAAQILIAARLHDIGKVGLPDEVWINPGTLTPAQQALVEEYPVRGATLMEAYPDFSRGLEIVRHHHERWDGSGYPDRLAGTDIPFGARVIAVADSFDAMTSERAHRRALSVEAAADILRNGAGRQWDPDIVRAFLHSIGHRLDESVTAGEAASALAPATVQQGVVA